MAAADYKILIEAVDKTKRPLSNIEKQLDRLEARSNRVSAAFKGLGAALAGVGVGAAVKSVVNITARYEDLQDTLNAVSGSARDGAKAFDFVKKFATKTQFGVEDLTKSYIQLKGAGLEPTEELLTTFTDTAAITTDQVGALEAMTKLFSRAASGAGVSLEELDMIADRGIPVYKILSDRIGITRDKLTDFAKEGDNAQLVLNELQAGLNESFGGATKGRLDNLSTSMSNFQIALQNSAAVLGGEFKGSLAGIINTITETINNNEALIQSIGQGLNTAIQSAVGAIQVLANNWELVKSVLIGIAAINIGPVMASAAGSVATFAARLGSLGGAATGLGPLLASPFTAIPAIIAGVVAGGLYYYRDEMINVGNTSATVGETLGAVWSLISEQARIAAQNVGQWFSEMYAYISSGEAIQDLTNNISAAWTYISDATRAVATNISDYFGSAWQSVIDGVGGIWNDYVKPVYELLASGVRNVANIYLNVWAGVGEFVGGVFTNIANNWSAVVESLGARAEQFKNAFFAIIERIKLAWAKMIQFIGQRFAALVEEVGRRINKFSEFTGIEIDTMGITAWASSLDAAVIRGQNAVEGFAGKAQESAAKANAALSGIQLIPEVDIDITRDRVGEIGTFVGESFQAVASTTSEFVLSQGQQIGEFMVETGQQVKDFTLSTGQAITEAVEQQIIVNREAEEARRQAALAASEQAQALADAAAAEAASAAATREAAAAQTTAGVPAATQYGEATGRLVEQLQAKKEKLADLEAALKNVSAIAKETGVSEEALTKALKEQIARLKGVEKASASAAKATSKLGKTANKTTKQVKSMGDVFKDIVGSRGTSLTSALTDDLLNARNPLDSFKDYFMGIFDDLTSRVVNQNVVEPFVNNLNGMLTGQMDALQGVAGQMGGGFGLNIGQGIGQMLGGFMNNISSGISNMFSGLFGSGGLGGMFSGGGGLFGGLGNFFSNAWGGIKSFGSSLFGGIGNLFSGGLGSLFGGFFADGGYLPAGKFGIAGEQGPELIKGPAQVFNANQVNTMMDDGESNTDPVAINFYLNAVDTQTGTQFLLDNRTKIIGMVNEAYRKQGKQGVY